MSQPEETQLTASSQGAKPTVEEVPWLTLLAHPDPSRVGERLAMPLLASGREVRLARLDPAFQAPRGQEAAPLDERSISRRPIRLVPGGGGSVTLDVASSRTALAADGEPVDGRRTFSAADVERGVVLQVGRRVVLLLHRMPLHAPVDEPDFGLVGENAAVVRLRQEIRRLAPLDVSVLLRGETGTGKELVARALHDAGPRRDQAFVAVNMGVLTASLAAADLFGAVRGAYTGAERAREGYFLNAQGGTLFLDEIGETPPEVQVALLRALEEGEVRPVGSSKARRVDVRLVTATDARLEEKIAAGRFSAPLYHRLASYPLHLPPLRERRDDVGRLLFFFLAEELAKLGKEALGAAERPWPPAELVARLARYDWPGNVRELRNVARRLAIAGPAASADMLRGLLDGDAVPVASPARPTEAAAPPAPPRPAYRPSHEVSEEELLEALAANRWRLKPTAQQLGVSRTTLYAMVDRSTAIRRASELSPEEIAGCRERHGGDVEAMAAELRVSSDGLRQRLRQLAERDR